MCSKDKQTGVPFKPHLLNGLKEQKENECKHTVPQTGWLLRRTELCNETSRLDCAMKHTQTGECNETHQDWTVEWNTSRLDCGRNTPRLDCGMKNTPKLDCGMKHIQTGLWNETHQDWTVEWNTSRQDCGMKHTKTGLWNETHLD